MILGKVVGTVVITVSHHHLDNRRLLVVQPLINEGDGDDAEFIAVDHSQAGIGDTVLVNREETAPAKCSTCPMGVSLLSLWGLWIVLNWGTGI